MRSSKVWAKAMQWGKYVPLLYIAAIEVVQVVAFVLNPRVAEQHGWSVGTIILGLFVLIAYSPAIFVLKSDEELDIELADKEMAEEVAAWKKKHPDLGRLYEFLAYEQQRQQRRAENRAFWQAIAQNALFFAFGIFVTLFIAGFR